MWSTAALTWGNIRSFPNSSTQVCWVWLLLSSSFVRSMRFSGFAIFSKRVAKMKSCLSGSQETSETLCPNVGTLYLPNNGWNANKQTLQFKRGKTLQIPCQTVDVGSLGCKPTSLCQGLVPRDKYQLDRLRS